VTEGGGEGNAPLLLIRKKKVKKVAFSFHIWWGEWAQRVFYRRSKGVGRGEDPFFGA